MVAREVQFRLHMIRAGVLTTWAIAGFGVLYLLTTWSGPHRTLLLAIAGAACLDALTISRLPWRRLIEKGVCERFLLGWNIAHIVVATVMCLLDGGASSPFMSIYFISAAFAAGSLPRGMVITVAALDVAAVLSLALAEGAFKGPSIVWSGTLVVLAGVCATIAQDRAERSAALQAANEQVPRHLARVVE